MLDSLKIRKLDSLETKNEIKKEMYTSVANF